MNIYGKIACWFVILCCVFGLAGIHQDQGIQIIASLAILVIPFALLAGAIALGIKWGRKQ